MNWLFRILGKKKKQKNREVKVDSEHKKGVVVKFSNPKYDSIDMSDSLLVFRRPFGEAIWPEVHLEKENYYNDLKNGGNVREVLKSHQTEKDCFDAFQMMHIAASTAKWNNFEKEYLQKPEYTEEDRRIDDSQDKGIYSYPLGISDAFKINESWIDDSYNSPSDSTSYDSSSSYDDSSTSSCDW